MLRYLLVDHAVPAMWRSLAAARLSADWPSGNAAHDAGAPPDLTQDALERVVGANPPPVLLREGVVGEYLLDLRDISLVDHAVPAMWRSLTYRIFRTKELPQCPRWRGLPSPHRLRHDKLARNFPRWCPSSPQP